MLKFSVLLFATLYLVILVAGLVLWTAATATGLRENVESFIGELIASEDFRILGPTMLRASVVGGLILVVLGTGANVLFAVLYNLISDVVGGIIVVFEERPTRRRPRAVTLTPPPGEEPIEPLRPTRPPRRGFAARLPGLVAPRDTGPSPESPEPVPPQQGEPVQVTRPAD